MMETEQVIESYKFSFNLNKLQIILSLISLGLILPFLLYYNNYKIVNNKLYQAEQRAKFCEDSISELEEEITIFHEREYQKAEANDLNNQYIVLRKKSL